MLGIPSINGGAMLDQKGQNLNRPSVLELFDTGVQRAPLGPLGPGRVRVRALQQLLGNSI
jgi:hypothetical protein